MSELDASTPGEPTMAQDNGSNQQNGDAGSAGGRASSDAPHPSADGQSGSKNSGGGFASDYLSSVSPDASPTGSAKDPAHSLPPTDGKVKRATDNFSNRGVSGGGGGGGGGAQPADHHLSGDAGAAHDSGAGADSAHFGDAYIASQSGPQLGFAIPVADIAAVNESRSAETAGKITIETEVQKVNPQTGKLETVAQDKRTVIPEVTVVGEARSDPRHLFNQQLMANGLAPVQAADYRPTPFEQRVSGGDLKGYYQPTYDAKTGDIVGYKYDHEGFHKEVNRDGKTLSSGEVPLEQPAVDPIDVIGPGEAKLAGKLAEATGRFVAKEAGKLAEKVVAKSVGEAAVKSGGEAITRDAAAQTAKKVEQSAGRSLREGAGHAERRVAAAPELDARLDEAFRATPDSQSGTYVGMRGTQARATYGESTMAFAHGERGWAFLDGPSGKGGHAWNAPGFYGVAVRRTAEGGMEVRVLDNKAFGAAKAVDSSSALTTNLTKNLEKLSEQVASPHYDNVPGIADLRQIISSSREAARAGRDLPNNLTLNITTYGGSSTKVGGALEGKVHFRGKGAD